MSYALSPTKSSQPKMALHDSITNSVDASAHFGGEARTSCMRNLLDALGRTALAWCRKANLWQILFKKSEKRCLTFCSTLANLELFNSNSISTTSMKTPHWSNRRIFPVATLLAVLLTSAVAIRSVQTAPSGRAALKGSKPSWANQSNYVSAADPKGGIGFRVYLGWTNPAGAEALARAVSDPRSSSYRQYLTPAQFRQQFAPTASQVAQVQNWLTNQGLSLVYTPANNHYVSAQGTVAQAQAAFGASFGVYKAKGLTLRSPSADVSIPSSLAGVVNAVIGLDQSYEFIHTNHIVDTKAPPSAGFRNAPPLSAYWAQFVSPYAYPSGFTDLVTPSAAPWSVRGHTPAQVKGAYGISGYDGTG